MLTEAPLAVLAVVAALLCWPDARARARLPLVRHDVNGVHRQEIQRSENQQQGNRPRKNPLSQVGITSLNVVVAAVVGGVTLGLAGACSAAVLVYAAARFWRARRRFRLRLARAAEFSSALRLFVAELRIGSHPATAADGAAQDASAEITPIFRSLAATTRLGGDATTILANEHVYDTELAEPLGRMARAWSLAERHGVALADLLDCVRRDVEHRATFARDVESRMAGPRTTAAVLSALPLLGIALGAASGADPIEVLNSGIGGQVLLLAGVGLLCAGITWTARLTRTAVGL